MVIKRARAWLARRSFDYQWHHLSTGTGLLDDPSFGQRVDEIVSAQELRLDRAWFPGRTVLDAGCGNGRWIEGFLRLGCKVTALDMSSHGLAQVRTTYGDKVRTVQGDVLRAASLLEGEQFDLVWSWGVLHHTRDTAAAIRELTRLVAPDGVLYLYLYGRESLQPEQAHKLARRRLMLNLLPMRVRRAVLVRKFGEARGNAAFDEYSTPLNDRFTFAEAEQMLRDAGWTHVLQTLDDTEIFVRASQNVLETETLPAPVRPYWFQQLSPS
jgi:SAM-dependent methyltransferase